MAGATSTSSSKRAIEMEIDLIVLLAKCGVPPNSWQSFQGLTKEAMSNTGVKGLSRLIPTGLVNRKSILTKIISELMKEEDDEGGSSSSPSVIELDLVLLLSECGLSPELFHCFLGRTKKELSNMGVKGLSRLLPPELENRKSIILQSILGSFIAELEEEDEEGQEDPVDPDPVTKAEEGNDDKDDQEGGDGTVNEIIPTPPPFEDNEEEEEGLGSRKRRRLTSGEEVEEELYRIFFPEPLPHQGTSTDTSFLMIKDAMMGSKEAQVNNQEEQLPNSVLFRQHPISIPPPCLYNLDVDQSQESQSPQRSRSRSEASSEMEQEEVDESYEFELVNVKQEKMDEGEEEHHSQLQILHSVGVGVGHPSWLENTFLNPAVPVPIPLPSIPPTPRRKSHPDDSESDDSGDEAEHSSQSQGPLKEEPIECITLDDDDDVQFLSSHKPSKKIISIQFDDEEDENILITEHIQSHPSSNLQSMAEGCSEAKGESSRKGRRNKGLFIRLTSDSWELSRLQIGSKASLKKTNEHGDSDSEGEPPERKDVHEVDDIHLNDDESGFTWKWKEWDKISTHGNQITRLDVLDWKWKPKSPSLSFNLFRMLTHYGAQLHQLSILSTPLVAIPSGEDVMVELTLPNLRYLKIAHSTGGSLGYEPLLSTIIKGAGGRLEKIQLISYVDEEALSNLLEILQELQPHYLKHLRVLSLQWKNTEERVALHDTDFTGLTNVRAINLQELELGFCIWGDEATKAEFEAMLLSFPNLKKLVVQGCFVNPKDSTGTGLKPKFTINFPKAFCTKLQVLELGQNYKYSSTFDSIQELPEISSRRRVTEPDPDPEYPNGRQTSRLMLLYQLPNDDIGDGYLRVALNFPGQMEKLRTLILGSSYDIADFHFMNMPELEVFRVASPWHLSSNVPLPVGSKKLRIYPSLKEFQFPDAFQDWTILPQIPKHFPNISKFYINLPTVTFLRAFAKGMASLRSFKHLVIKIHWDFPSSLNSAFLNEPRTVAQSREELKQIRVLKGYDFWEEFVAYHRIEVPDLDSSPGEEAQFAGLETLKGKLKSFEIHHVPRILRLPKGAVDWNHHRRQFTNTLIGFREYPLSKEASKIITAFKKTTFRTYHFNLSHAKEFTKFTFHASEDGGCELDVEMAYPPRSKRENRDE